MIDVCEEIHTFVFEKLSRDNDNFSNQITDANKACQAKYPSI